MFTILVLAHLAVFGACFCLDDRKGVNRLRNLTIPVGLGFLFVAVLQAPAARKDVAIGLVEGDLAAALLFSLLCYAACVAAWRISRWSRGRSMFVDRAMDSSRLMVSAVIMCIVGLLGYAAVIYLEGGLWSYFGAGQGTGSQFSVSGYVYVMKYASYGSVALLLCVLAFHRLGRAWHLLLVAMIAILTWEAVKLTDRGDTIRAGMLWLGWAYFASSTRSGRGRHATWGYVVVAVAAIGMATGIILLPHFRDSGRNIVTSQVTLDNAWMQAKEGGMGSRYSAKNGGEFDTAARIMKRVRTGEIEHPGPVHFAHWAWNVVPRALVPQKHEWFADWAGPDWEEVRFGSCSYFGCSSTGAGEAYGMMGWWGLLYWAALGLLLRRLEGWFEGSRTGLIVTVICYLPLLQFVMQDFWAGAMNASIVVIPVILFLKWAQRPQPRKQGKRRPYPESRRSNRGRCRRESNPALIA